MFNGNYWEVTLEDRQYAQSFVSIHKNSVIGNDPEAVAREIAALPDLLKALKTIAEYGEPYTSELASAAISKAQGEQP